MITKIKMNFDKLLKLTHRLDFFDAMSEHERFDVLQRLEANVSMHPKGATIIDERRSENHIFIVLSGLVTIQKGDPVHTVLNVIEPGDFFGEISFITQISGNASVVANEDTIVLSLNNEELDALNGLVRDKIKDKIIFRLVKRLKHMNSLVLKMEEDKQH